MFSTPSTAEVTSILLVEDQEDIRRMLSFTLSRTGYYISEAADCDGARSVIENHIPDLVVLDWMLPDHPGLELLREIRRNPKTRQLPVVMLTARADESDKISALKSGADDYITKPFSRDELLLRIEAILRRSKPDYQTEQLEYGNLVLDPACHRLLVDGETMHLGRLEFRLLHFLMLSPNRVFNRSQLLDNVWQNVGYVENRTVDVHIMRIRKALGRTRYASCIETIRGLGYRFSPDKLEASDNNGVLHGNRAANGNDRPV